MTAHELNTDRYFAEFKRIACEAEIFLFESSANDYKPAPLEGWFALRSNKRRIFMRLNNRSIPPPDEIQARLSIGEFMSYPL